jgi:hypothetical protein
MASDWVFEFQKLLMDGYNSTERPMKKEIRRIMVAFLVCIDFSLVLWFSEHMPAPWMGGKGIPAAGA